MNEESELPLLKRMRENARLVDAMFERMLKEAMEFGEMVRRNQTGFSLDRKKPRYDDWNVDNR